MENGNENSCLTWRVWPMYERHIKTLLMFLVTFAFLLSVFIFSKNYYAVVFACIVFLFELRRYIFPTMYKLEQSGIREETLFRNKFYPWAKYKSAFVDLNGVLLSPYSNRTFMERFKGYYVLFGANTPSGAKEYILNKY